MKQKKSDVKRKELYKFLLEVFDLKDDFLRLPFDIKQSFYEFTWPKIRIESDGVHPAIKEVEEIITQNLSNNFIEINDNKIPIDKFYAVIGMYSFFKSYHSGVILTLRETKLERKIKENQNILSVLTSIVQKIEKIMEGSITTYLDKICLVASQEVFKYLSINEPGIYPEFILKNTEGKKKYPTIKIHSYEPKEETLKLDGQIRTGYKCFGFSAGKIKDTVWKENIIGNDKPAKVYIQEHAINRLLERCGVGPHKGYVFDSILRSLEDPVVCGTDGPSHLIEYKYYTIRMGYFLASLEKDCVIVRTFKFITMVGTPEFYMLRRALKGTKEDFEYLGIDSIEVLLNSDIYKDEKLMGIFQRCGLSDILKFGKGINFQKPKNMIAEEIRNYFRI